MRDGAARFQYVVRSGGTWAKPIGSETVVVRVDAPLKLRAPGKFKPARQEDGRWTWVLKDVRPTEDVEATIEIGDATLFPSSQKSPASEAREAADEK